LSSTPDRNTRSRYDFNANANDLSYGFKRSRLAWYSIDPIFYTKKPLGISNDDLSLNTTRRIYSEELYPLTDIAGQSQVINTLDLSIILLKEAYNNDVNFAADAANFGGIMRSLNLLILSKGMWITFNFG
jgi:cell surface protein SprA